MAIRQVIVTYLALICGLHHISVGWRGGVSSPLLDRGLMTSPEDEDDLVVEILSGPLGLSFAPVCSPWKANHQMVKRWSMGGISPGTLLWKPQPSLSFFFVQIRSRTQSSDHVRVQEISSKHL